MDKLHTVVSKSSIRMTVAGVLLAETGSGFSSRESQVRCRVRPDVRLNSESVS